MPLRYRRRLAGFGFVCRFLLTKSVQSDMNLTRPARSFQQVIEIRIVAEAFLRKRRQL